MPERLTLAPGVEVPAPEDGSVLRYSVEAVQDVLDFFSLLCFAQNEWAGKPFELLPWEEEAVRQFYGIQVQDEDGLWVRYRRYLSTTSCPKKTARRNWRPAWACITCCTTARSGRGWGCSLPTRRTPPRFTRRPSTVENTSRSTTSLPGRVDSRKEIHTKYGGVLKVYSADAATKHGYSFSAIIIDELHAQPNRRLWDVLTAGSNAARRQQAVIVLTTAGDDPDRTSIGWEVHEKCRRILAWRRGEPEREGDADAPEWCPIMYGIGILAGDDPERIAELDIYDEALWYACNPGLGHNLKLRDFRADARAARQSEAAERWFRWLRLNQWISTKSVGWLPLTIYDKTQFNRPEWKVLNAPARRQAARDYLAGKKCFGGLDLSTTTDLTAFTLLFPPQEGLDTWAVLFWAWRPEEGVLEAEQRDHVPYRDWARAGFLALCPGDMVDFTMVEDAVAAAADVFDLDTLGVDPYLSRTLTPRLMERGVNVVEIPQDMKNLSPAMKEIERLIRAHQMLHEHNTAARWCWGNVRCAVDGNENIKPMKNRSIGRIDITVAWIISMAVALLRMPVGPDINEHILSEDWGI